MATFSAYLAPTVTTSVVYEQGGVTLFGSTVIPVLIGEGQETRTNSGVELIRGSSAVADNLVVSENLTAQVDGFTTGFTLSYGPIVNGNGNGTITNDPTLINVYTLDSQANQIPLQVVSLNGLTRSFKLATLLLAGSPLYATYYFKRTDTLIKNEDLSDQIPAFAALTFQGVSLTLTQPGFSGNSVTLALTAAEPGSGVSDQQAVSGNGSDVISIELRQPDNNLRTSYDLQQLIQAGINTASGGQLAYVSPTVGAPLTLAALSPTAFVGGSGQNTNTTFKLKNVPVVDGTDGGVVTNLPANLTVTMNNTVIPAIALAGATGLFTLVQGVAYGSRLLVSYYTNTYQDTTDLLPFAGVTAAQSVGYAPGRNDFVSGVDFLLGADGDLHWGNAELVTPGTQSTGYTPFDKTAVTTTLIDEKMFLRPCSGVVDGINTRFTLADLPCDGSNLGVTTDNTMLVNVYVGATPFLAYEAGPVRVVRLTGASGTLTLFNPPPASAPGAPVNVYATYWRNTMGNHSFTATVLTPGGLGQGSYQLADEAGNVAPALAVGDLSGITQANAAITGLIWPGSKCDLRGVMGRSPDETITLTFQTDTVSVTSGAVQAVNPTALEGVLFSAIAPGVAPNAVNPAVPLATEPTISIVSATACADSAAITVVGELISININRATTDASQLTRTLGDIVDLVNAGVGGVPFTDVPATGSSLLGGLAAVLQTGWSATTLATPGHPTGFTGGAASVSASASTHFKVTSSRTAADTYNDGLGLTGGATTNAAAPTLGADGWLNQTFEDAYTGVTFTLVDPSLAFDNPSNPNVATDYGFTTCPRPAWQFMPGDKVVFNVTQDGVQLASALPNLALYGLTLQLPTTYGMHPGDTLTVQTHDRAGSAPAVGEYYYADLVVQKSAAEMATVHYYTGTPGLTSDMGAALPVNKASLGGSLMFANGANLIAVLQVPRQTSLGLQTASDAAFTDAIASLRKALPIAGHKANVIVPMSTSQPVISYLSQHLTTQASPRNKGEAIGFVGLPLTGTAADAAALAPALNSERMILAYPGGATVAINQNGVTSPFAVGGEFLAAGLAGLFLNPSNDVATDLSLQMLTGFQNLISQTEEPIMDMLASNGVTVLVQTPAGIQIRQYVTTSTDSVLMIEPYVTTSVDYARQRTRQVLQQFIGKKNVQNRLTDIALAVNGLMAQLVASELLGGFQPAVVTPSATDQRVVNVAVNINPMMSILWINVKFTVTSSNTPTASNS